MAEVLTEELNFGRYSYGRGVDGTLVRKLIWINDTGYSGYALALDFKNAQYWSSGTSYALTALPGYSYTRSGAVSFVNNSGTVSDFAANVAPVLSGIGYEAYGALTNSVLQSQAFDNATWSKTNVTVTANTVTAPDGTTTADKLTTSGAVAAQSVDQGYAVVALTTYSVFVKAGSQQFIQLSSNTNAAMYANFDLTNGTVGTVGGSAAGYVVACGSGWYRCVLVITTASAGAVTAYLVAASNSAYGGVSSASVTDLYLWQAQTLTGNFPDGGPIIATTGATASIGASALSGTFNPITTDQDFIAWAVVNFSGVPASTFSTAGLLFDLGTSTDDIRVFLDVSGIASLNMQAASVNNTITAGGVMPAGRSVVLIRRKSGKNTVATKLPNGTVTIGTESGAVTFPAMTSAIKIGTRYDGAFPPFVPEEGVFIRTGTFSDAQLTTILTAA